MPMIGEIQMFAGGFVPAGWTPCDGHLEPINSTTAALFSVIGTTYGGDGSRTFAVPDLRGRVAIHGPAIGTVGGGGGLAPMQCAAGAGTDVMAAAGGADNHQPYLVVQFIIATTGTYPTRS